MDRMVPMVLTVLWGRMVQWGSMGPTAPAGQWVRMDLWAPMDPWETTAVLEVLDLGLGSAQDLADPVGRADAEAEGDVAVLAAREEIGTTGIIGIM